MLYKRRTMKNIFFCWFSVYYEYESKQILQILLRSSGAVNGAIYNHFRCTIVEDLIQVRLWRWCHMNIVQFCGC